MNRLRQKSGISEKEFFSIKRNVQSVWDPMSVILSSLILTEKFQSKNVENRVYYATLNQLSEAAIGDMDLIRGALESWGPGLSNAHPMVIVSILLDPVVSVK